MNALLHLLVAFLLSLAGQKISSSPADATTPASDNGREAAAEAAAPAATSEAGALAKALAESSAAAKPTSTPVVPSTKPIVRPPSWPKPNPKHPTLKACPPPPACAGAIGFCPSYRCEDGVLVRQPNTKKPSTTRSSGSAE